MSLRTAYNIKGKIFFYLRYCHNNAQSEQHEEAVQHLNQLLATALLTLQILDRSNLTKLSHGAWHY